MNKQLPMLEDRMPYREYRGYRESNEWTSEGCDGQSCRVRRICRTIACLDNQNKVRRARVLTSRALCIGLTTLGERRKRRDLK